MNICPHCQIGFKAYEDYHDHIQTHRKIKSVQSDPNSLAAQSRMTSGRTKTEIVQQAEASWLAPLLITSSNESEHLNSCRCHLCWLKMADKLIKTQEENLNG